MLPMVGETSARGSAATGGLAHVLNVVEAAYRVERRDVAWLDGMAEAAHPVMGEGLGVTAYVVECSPLGVRIADFVRRGIAPPREVVSGMLQLMHEDRPEVAERDFFYGRDRVGTMSGKLAQLGTAHLDGLFVAQLQPFGFVDSLGLTATDGGPEVLILASSLSERRDPRPDERRTWSRVASHLTNALRLRRRLKEGPELAVGDESHPLNEAILTPTGKVEHARGLAKTKSAREELRQAVRQLDWIRARRGGDDPEDALRLWRALCAGRWTLLDRFDADGRRYVTACKNELPTPALPRLSQREREVAQLVAIGRSNSEIAYELGLDVSSVATHLSRALDKLGVGGRVELCNIWATLHHADSRRYAVETHPRHLDAVSAPAVNRQLLERLTAAEQEVARAILEGRDNRSIATRRGTSLRTVANQVASILRKTGAQSRADIASRLGSRG